MSQGAFGKVVKGSSVATSQAVAIKIVRESGQDIKGSMHEAIVWSQMHHVGVAKLLDYWRVEDEHRLIMEWSGFSLEALREARSLTTSPQIRTIASHIVAALGHIHHRDVVHNHISSGTVLFDASDGPHGRAKLTDFASAGVKINKTGFATSTGRDDSAEPSRRWYRPPEILLGLPGPDFSTDIWSFSCVFGELVTGAVLFPGVTDADIYVATLGFFFVRLTWPFWSPISFVRPERIPSQ